MKRPIKFRGRDINTDEFVYGEVVNGNSVGYWARVYGEWELKWNSVKRDSIVQLVGYDKDGNEVYEDDKVVSEYGDEIVARLMDNLPPKATLQEATK